MAIINVIMADTVDSSKRLKLLDVSDYVAEREGCYYMKYVAGLFNIRHLIRKIIIAGEHSFYLVIPVLHSIHGI
jgi:hypothetical protein